MFKRVSILDTVGKTFKRSNTLYTLPLDILEKNKIQPTSSVSYDANTCSAVIHKRYDGFPPLLAKRKHTITSVRGFCRVYCTHNNAVYSHDFLRLNEFAMLSITKALTDSNHRYLVSPRGDDRVSVDDVNNWNTDLFGSQ